MAIVGKIAWPCPPTGIYSPPVVNDFVQVGNDFILEGNDFVPVGSDFFGGEKGHRQEFKEVSDFCLMRTTVNSFEFSCLAFSLLSLILLKRTRKINFTVKDDIFIIKMNI